MDVNRPPTVFRSMIFFVSRLKPKIVENRVLKLLIKMMQDQLSLGFSNWIKFIARFLVFGCFHKWMVYFMEKSIVRNGWWLGDLGHGSISVRSSRPNSPGSRGLDQNQCLDLRGPCVYTIAPWMAPALALQRGWWAVLWCFCHCFLLFSTTLDWEDRSLGSFFVSHQCWSCILLMHLSQRTEERPKETRSPDPKSGDRWNAPPLLYNLQNLLQ